MCCKEVLDTVQDTGKKYVTTRISKFTNDQLERGLYTIMNAPEGSAFTPGSIQKLSKTQSRIILPKGDRILPTISWKKCEIQELMAKKSPHLLQRVCRHCLRHTKPLAKADFLFSTITMNVRNLHAVWTRKCPYILQGEFILCPRLTGEVGYSTATERFPTKLTKRCSIQSSMPPKCPHFLQGIFKYCS